MLVSHRWNILQDEWSLFCWCSRTFSCKFEWQWYIGKARIGRLMSLLDSLKFCVIEHQPVWLMIFCLVFYKGSLYSISFVDSTYIERNWHFVDQANSEIFFDKVLYPDFAKSIFIGGDLSASCLSSWQIKHFNQSVLCFSWADKESRILFDIVTNNPKKSTKNK